LPQRRRAAIGHGESSARPVGRHVDADVVVWLAPTGPGVPGRKDRPDEGDASQTLVLGTPLDEEGDEKRAADLDDQPHTDDEFDDGDELEDNDALETIGLAWGEESAADQEEPAAKDSLFDLDDSLAGEEFDLDTLNRLTTEPTGGENQLDAPSSSGSDEGGLRDEDAEVKLDLARAYLSMDDPELARTLLEEIVSGGSVAMRERAQSLLDEI